MQWRFTAANEVHLKLSSRVCPVLQGVVHKSVFVALNYDCSHTAPKPAQEDKLPLRFSCTRQSMGRPKEPCTCVVHSFASYMRANYWQKRFRLPNRYIFNENDLW